MEPILKGQIVDIALNLLSISGTLINPTGKDQEDFLRFEEIMISSWENEGIFLGFHFSPFGIASDAADISGIEYNNVNAVATCLAVYGASSKGLVPPQSLRSEAFIAKMNIHPAHVIERNTVVSLPVGAGNRKYAFDGSRYPESSFPFIVENGGDLDELEY
jgi:hypothetical protein